MAWPYLPVNPECRTNPCNPTPTTSDLLTYAGPNLPCTGINSCDTLSVALQKIDNEICELKDAIFHLTSTTTTAIPATTTSTSSSTTTTSSSTSSSTTSTTTTVNPECVTYVLYNSGLSSAEYGYQSCPAGDEIMYGNIPALSYTTPFCATIGTLFYDPSIIIDNLAPGCIPPPTTSTTSTTTTSTSSSSTTTTTTTAAIDCGALTGTATEI
jgi:hypothetical protein